MVIDIAKQATELLDKILRVMGQEATAGGDESRALRLLNARCAGKLAAMRLEKVPPPAVAATPPEAPEAP